MPSKNVYTFKGKVWLWHAGEGSWHFVSLPKGKSAGISKLYAGMKAGFGSLPVEATIGTTTWKTSMFPDNKSGAYILPLKKDVRKKENISEGDTISYSIIIRI